MTALAVADSSSPNAIAVGPISSGPRASPIVSAAAIRSRRFLTTRYDTSCLRRARRISAISLTVRPRYSETISVLLPARAWRSSATVSRLASVGIRCPPSSAHGRCAAVARRGPETTTPLRRRLFGWPERRGAATAKVGRTGPASACSSASPIARRDRSGPTVQAPTVTHLEVAVRGRRLSLAVPSIFSCDVARRVKRCRRRVWWRSLGGVRRGEDRGDVDPDAGAHRRRDREGLQVLAL